MGQSRDPREREREREREELLEECVNLRGERDSDFIDRHINRGSICSKIMWKIDYQRERR